MLCQQRMSFLSHSNYCAHGYTGPRDLLEEKVALDKSLSGIIHHGGLSLSKHHPLQGSSIPKISRHFANLEAVNLLFHSPSSAVQNATPLKTVSGGKGTPEQHFREYFARQCEGEARK